MTTTKFLKRKLFLSIGLLLFLFIACEKIELKPDKLNGIYVSSLFKLANQDSAQFNLVINESLIQKGYLNPPHVKYKYSFKTDSIINNISNHNNWIISTIYFHFQSHHGTLEIEETNSKNYKLIGHLNIKNSFIPDNKWEYVLYFTQ